MSNALLDLQTRLDHQVITGELLDNVGVPDHVSGHHGVLAESKHCVDVGLTLLVVSHEEIHCSNNANNAQTEYIPLEPGVPAVPDDVEHQGHGDYIGQTKDAECYCVQDIYFF